MDWFYLSVLPGVRSVACIVLDGFVSYLVQKIIKLKSVVGLILTHIFKDIWSWLWQKLLHV